MREISRLGRWDEGMEDIMTLAPIEKTYTAEDLRSEQEKAWHLGWSAGHYYATELSYGRIPLEWKNPYTVEAQNAEVKL